MYSTQKLIKCINTTLTSEPLAEHQLFCENSQFLQITGNAKSFIELGILNVTLNSLQLK